ncbi:MAG: hypothetical protein E7C50_00320 [Clostridium sp.]|uniref:hypothetical protein n=1 Tax=Clostridium sp. TaxID=1506 RepID=UPI0029030892|nr:hypothetical protein [Clostridium sp.]MDU2674208.1 hypothetical protein [Clostridium sp.]MDU2680303.1 hypothetical protein [Clostridium sp.]
MAKKKSGYTISDNAKEYIKKYKELNKLSSQSSALERIIKEHKEFKQETRGKEIEELANKLSKKVVEELKGMKLGVDNADRNTQILIEMINGKYIKDRVGDIPTTTGISTKFARKSEALEIAENEVKKRIHRAKVMKSYE